MESVQSVVGKAKELLESVGQDEARKFFEKKIKDFGEPKSMQDFFIVTSFEYAIDIINKNGVVKRKK